MQIPTLNMEQFRSTNETQRSLFVETLGAGLQEFGFIIVEGHEIPSTLIQKSYSNTKQFFDLSTAQKSALSAPIGRGQRGYTSFRTEHAKHSNIPDLKEFWHVGRSEFQIESNRKLYPDNIWPDAYVPDFKNTLSQLYVHLDQLASHLLSAISLFLNLGPTHLPRMITDGNSILRLLHYPALTDHDTNTTAVRAAAHEDINFITLLCEASQSGLEILTRQGKWLAVECKPGQIVVDSGDMLSRLTNNIIPSTTHRVVNPPGAKNIPRYSMPFFAHPYQSCDLTVLQNCISPTSPAKYAPITAGDFLAQRLREIGLATK